MGGDTMMFKDKSILVYDTETDSLDINKAKVKWFGAYSYLYNHYYLFPFEGNEKEIRKLLEDHKVLVGFNNKEYDNPIIENSLQDDRGETFEYKVLIDLLEISAPKGGSGFGKNRKNKLAQMGIKLKSHSLKNIIENLKLDDSGTKGDIDYKIFQKDSWTPEESAEIRKYLKQDIELTRKLFEWYEVQFLPLKRFLPKKDQDNFLYLKASLSVLAYNIICNKAGLKPEFGEKVKVESYHGGHHIEPRQRLVKGNIIEVDFTSAYPHAIMMGNLHSTITEGDGWDGDGYYKLEGKYNNKEQGKIELALKDIFIERLKAKQAGEKEKDKSYKIVINSHYGTCGNPIFKSVYNRTTASDCTSIVRTWMKKLAQTLELNGFVCLYGFTDSIFVLVPKTKTKHLLLNVINTFIEEAKSHMPFPMDTFKMGIEAEIKMIWFVAKNCYLFVNKDNKIEYKSTLLNTNTPNAVMKLFKEYMEPLIIEKLDVLFTQEDLEKNMKPILEKDLTLAAQEYKVVDCENYKVQTSLQCQISRTYGPGRHLLIPNKKGIGVGLSKSTKKRIGVRYCTIEEFKSNGLTIEDIDMSKLLSHLKPFYEKQTTLQQGNEAVREVQEIFP